MREIREGTYDGYGCFDLEPLDQAGELLARVVVAVPAEADRSAADALDDVEHRVALLSTEGLAEDTPEETDVFSQGASHARLRRRVRRFALDDSHIGGHDHDSGCPVDSTTDIQRSLVVSTCFLYLVARGSGTWTNRPCQRPMSISVLPAIAACTALRAMFQQ